MSKKATKKRVARALTPRQKRIAKLIKQRGSVADFARDLSRLTGRPVSWETVYGWIRRGGIPKRMLLPVHQLTGAPFVDLLR
jgi:hypothetical protein